MSNTNNYFESVKSTANGRWFEILNALAPCLDNAIARCPKHGPCPVHGGKDGFRFFKDGNQTGGAISNADGPFSNGFALLMWLWDCDFKTVLKAVGEYLNIGNVYDKYPRKAVTQRVRAQQTKVDKRQNDKLQQCEKLRAYLREVWSQSCELSSPEAKLARMYLDSRGLDLQRLNLVGLSKTIRFHPSLPLYHDKMKIGEYPALVTMVRYQDGNPACLHRTYLDQSGHKLRMVREGVEVSAKKLTPSCEDRLLSGGAIQLGIPHQGYLHITEGIETALSVMQVTQEAVWPCVSSTLLSKFNPPEGVTHLFIWADKDRERNGKCAGLAAATELVERMAEMDIECTILYPPSDLQGKHSVDWNDELVSHGEHIFPAHHVYLWQGG